MLHLCPSVSRCLLSVLLVSPSATSAIITTDCHTIVCSPFIHMFLENRVIHIPGVETIRLLLVSIPLILSLCLRIDMLNLRSLNVNASLMISSSGIGIISLSIK